jgi:hypothetical protein
MPELNESRIKRAMLDKTNREFRDLAYGRTKKATYEIYDEDTEKWKDFRFSKEMILLHEPGESPVDVITELSEISDSPVFKELRKFMGTGAGKKVLAALQHIHTTISGTGAVSIRSIFEINSRAKNLIIKAGEFTDKLDNALLTVRGLDKEYDKFKDILSTRALAFGGVDKRDIADTINRERLSVSKTGMDIVLGGSSTQYKNNLSMLVGQLRRSRTRQERLLEEAKIAIEYDRDIGISSRDLVGKVFDTLETMPGSRAKRLASSDDNQFGDNEYGRFTRGIWGHLPKNDEEMADDAKTRLNFRKLIRESTTPEERAGHEQDFKKWIKAQDKRLLSRKLTEDEWRQREQRAAASRPDFLVEALISHQDHISAEKGMDWSSLKSEVLRRSVTKMELIEQIVEGMELEDAVKSGKFKGMSMEDIRKVYTAHIITQGSGVNTAMHESKFIEYGRGRFPVEHAILNADLTGSPEERGIRVGPTPMTGADTIRHKLESYARELGKAHLGINKISSELQSITDFTTLRMLNERQKEYERTTGLLTELIAQETYILQGLRGKDIASGMRSFDADATDVDTILGTVRDMRKTKGTTDKIPVKKGTPVKTGEPRSSQDFADIIHGSIDLETGKMDLTNEHILQLLAWTGESKENQEEILRLVSGKLSPTDIDRLES